MYHIIWIKKPILYVKKGHILIDKNIPLHLSVIFVALTINATIMPMRSVIIQDPGHGLFKNHIQPYQAKDIQPDREKIKMILEKTITADKYQKLLAHPTKKHAALLIYFSRTIQ